MVSGATPVASAQKGESDRQILSNRFGQLQAHRAFRGYAAWDTPLFVWILGCWVFSLDIAEIEVLRWPFLIL